MTAFRIVLIANPGTKRCEAYRRSVADFSVKQSAPINFEVVPWSVVVQSDGNLDHLRAFDRPAVVRLESPGKDVTVYRQLLAAGARATPIEPPRNWTTVELPKGILYRPGLWYRGFRHVLEGLKRSFVLRPHLKPTACPLAVAAMFDKNVTLSRLHAASLSVPKWFPPAPSLSDSTDVINALHATGWPVLYFKLNTGASATGIVVLRFDTHGTVGLTTLLPRGDFFFNTRQIREVTGDELCLCLRFLWDEGATIQKGLPHAQLDGQNADLRVVCVRGKPVATIFRLSPHPITNLHLGGRRGDFARCRAAIPTRDWLDALESCAEAAGCFDTTIAGVDLLFEPGFRRHHILEVNAFGDFFPGWTDATGRNLHEIELTELATQ